MLGDKSTVRNGPGQRPAMNPFGQNNDDNGNGNMNTSDRLPAETLDQLQRSQRIFEELRQRRNNPDRPRIEKDYLDRLLRQF